LLATGNEAYRAFRGRDPDVDALLRRRAFRPAGWAAAERAGVPTQL